MSQIKNNLLLIILLFSTFTNAQEALGELLKQYNNETIPYISVSALRDIQNQIVLLDAREKNEFEVSHIKNATLAGYNHFKIETITEQNIKKNDTIIVYCSLGVRSEDISEKLKAAGYTNVFNLYGGIFEWKNNNYPVINSKGEVTEKIHACSKQWGKWLQKGQKVYSN